MIETGDGDDGSAFGDGSVRVFDLRDIPKLVIEDHRLGSVRSVGSFPGDEKETMIKKC